MIYEIIRSSKGIPSSYDIFIDLSRHVETVVLLSHEEIDGFIEVKMDYQDNISRTPNRITYKLLQAFIEDKYDFKVHTAYIADGRDGNASMGKSIGKALRGNAGCLILRGTDKKGKGIGYTLTMGRSLYEAIVALTVLEKSAEISFLAEKIGGAGP